MENEKKRLDASAVTAPSSSADRLVKLETTADWRPTWPTGRVRLLTVSSSRWSEWSLPDLHSHTSLLLLWLWLHLQEKETWHIRIDTGRLWSLLHSWDITTGKAWDRMIEMRKPLKIQQWFATVKSFSTVTMFVTQTCSYQKRAPSLILQQTTDGIDH